MSLVEEGIGDGRDAQHFALGEYEIGLRVSATERESGCAGQARRNGVEGSVADDVLLSGRRRGGWPDGFATHALHRRRR